MARPEEVLRRIEAEAARERLPIIGPYRGKILDEIVLKFAPKNVLEINTLVGYSAIRIARPLPAGGMLTCVDVDAQAAMRAKSNIRTAGLEDSVEVLVGNALEIIPRLKLNLDMLFIDAEKSEYMEYLKRCERMLHTGSVVVADNVKTYAHRMEDYLEYVRSSGLYRSTTGEGVEMNLMPDGDAPEISVKMK